MRKRYKIKRHACGLCKPHKRGWRKRLKDPDVVRLEESEREIRDAEIDSTLDRVFADYGDTFRRLTDYDRRKL